MVTFQGIMICLNLITVCLMLEGILVQRQTRLYSLRLMMATWAVFMSAIVMLLINIALWVAGTWGGLYG